MWTPSTGWNGLTVHRHVSHERTWMWISKRGNKVFRLRSVWNDSIVNRVGSLQVSKLATQCSDFADSVRLSRIASLSYWQLDQCMHWVSSKQSHSIRRNISIIHCFGVQAIFLDRILIIVGDITCLSGRQRCQSVRSIRRFIMTHDSWPARRNDYNTMSAYVICAKYIITYLQVVVTEIWSIAGNIVRSYARLTVTWATDPGLANLPFGN